MLPTLMQLCELNKNTGFAQLHHVNQVLAKQLARLAPGGVAYLPITFAGETTFGHQFQGTASHETHCINGIAQHLASIRPRL